MAQGRVWSGTQALGLQLIDNKGTLHQSIDAAARIAGLGSDYDVVYDEWKLSPFETMLFEMVGSAMVRFELGLSASPLGAHTLFGKILQDLQFLAASNEGLTIAAHCLCEVD